MEGVIRGGGRSWEEEKGETVKKNGMTKNKEQQPSKTFMHNEFSQAFEESRMNLEQLVMKSPQKTER